jgi:hypothetical protein
MTETAATRPAICTDEHLEFLDRLRASGRTNMYGASPYLQTEFALDKNEARDVLRYWMDSFTERQGGDE